jgi:hypothetical protein
VIRQQQHDGYRALANGKQRYSRYGYGYRVRPPYVTEVNALQ